MSVQRIARTIRWATEIMRSAADSGVATISPANHRHDQHMPWIAGSNVHERDDKIVALSNKLRLQPPGYDLAKDTGPHSSGGRDIDRNGTTAGNKGQRGCCDTKKSRHRHLRCGSPGRASLPRPRPAPR
jgi:hypothetical protein